MYACVSVCNQFVHPAAYRPDSIMAVTSPPTPLHDLIPSRSCSFPRGHTIPCHHGGAPPKTPTKRRKRGKEEKGQREKTREKKNESKKKPQEKGGPGPPPPPPSPSRADSATNWPTWVSRREASTAGTAFPSLNTILAVGARGCPTFSHSSSLYRGQALYTSDKEALAGLFLLAPTPPAFIQRKFL